MNDANSADMCEVRLPGHGEAYAFRVAKRNLGEVLTPVPARATQALSRLVERALCEPLDTPPLAALARAGTTALIVVDDITRGTPTAEIVPAVLRCLLEAGCRERDITFAVALGTHRPMTTAEIEHKLGRDIVARFPVINTPAQTPGAFVDTGEAWDGVPIEVHRAVLAADLVIGIGSVVPHADAGWSGGCKIILPGLCSERTVVENHVLGARYAENLLGREETPIRLNMEGVVGKIGLDYVLNLVMTPFGEVIDVLGGHFVAAQRAAVRAARPIYSVPFQQRADVVVSNSYPADIDLWQASKGIWAGDLLVKPGGTVILHGPCPEGIGPHAEYLRIMQRDPDEVLRALAAGEPLDRAVVGGAVPIGRMLKDWRLVIVSPGLRRADFGSGPIAYHPDLQQAVDAALDAYGAGARLSVITHGGYAFPIPA